MLDMQIKTYDMRTLQNTLYNQRHPNNSGQKVRAEVVLGSPSANCSGVGICRVMAQGEGTEYKCPCIPAQLSITAEGKIRFEFNKASMEGRYLRRHFRWALFQVFEAYTIPYSVLGNLKIEQRTIRPGIYQVIETNERMIVEF